MRSIANERNGAASLLTAIIVLIAVMFATIIGAIIFFEFGSASQTSRFTTDTTAIADVNLDTYYNLSATPDSSTPNFNVSRYNGTYVGIDSAWITRNGRAVQVGWEAYGTGNTTLRFQYNAQGYTEVGTVINYAVTVFALLAIVPLVIVGGLMLNSLGFMTGGKSGNV